MISLVALTPAWEPMSVDAVRSALDALFPGEFLPAREEGNFVIDGPVTDASYLVQCNIAGHEGMFLIHNVPGPYSAFSDFLEHIENPELRELAADQPCWMSVDLMHRHTSDESAWRFIGVILATLAPAESVLLVHPGLHAVARFTPDVRAVLSSGGSPFGTA